jgi:REP element-mobilizing transposase RayT
MLPRPILPGATYLISRRCSQRQFLLLPTPTTTDIITYCLAVAAARCNVRVHAVCALSNHVHAIVTDPDARLPEFLAYFHKYVAKAVNAALGRWENLWASEAPSFVRLLTADDVLEKLRYLVCNPVEAELVKRANRWPGLLRYLPRHSVRVPRPPVLFRADGPMPAVAALVLTLPPALAELGEVEVEARLEAAVRATEDRVAQELKAAGRWFLGVEGVLAQRPTDTPHTREPRRVLSPQVASRSKWHRIEALQRLKAFVAAYRDAWRRWRAGAAEVVFPYGTYALRRHAGVVCETAPG